MWIHIVFVFEYLRIRLFLGVCYAVARWFLRRTEISHKGTERKEYHMPRCLLPTSVLNNILTLNPSSNSIAKVSAHHVYVCKEVTWTPSPAG